MHLQSHKSRYSNQRTIIAEASNDFRCEVLRLPKPARFNRELTSGFRSRVDTPELGSLSSASAISTWEDALRECVDLIRDAVPDADLTQWQRIGSRDLIEYANSLQLLYSKRKSNKCLQFFAPFLQCLKTRASAIDMMVQVDPSVAGLVWGSVRWVLQAGGPKHTIRPQNN